MAIANKKNTYKIINSETKKILKYAGRLQYFRTKSTALYEKIKLERDLKLKLEIEKCLKKN